MTSAEAKFTAFIAAITDPALRSRVEDTALTNAFEFPSEFADDATRWQVALSTAEMAFDCARDYYPELFADGLAR